MPNPRRESRLTRATAHPREFGNKLYYMTDRPDLLEPPDDEESDAVHLVYTHGSVHRYELLNTEEQIDRARTRNASSLTGFFHRLGVIVIGYSGWRDTTMDALLACDSFRSNLYWCDIHPAAEAESRLRPEARALLEAREKHVFYVPIEGADEAMRLMHRELRLGDVPKFILDPVGTRIDQLESIQLPVEPAAPSATLTAPLSATSLADLLKGTLKRLEVAKNAFDEPSIVQSSSVIGQTKVAEALTAQLFSDAYVAYSKGATTKGIELLDLIIRTDGVPARDRARALFNRGLMWAVSHKREEATADYTKVIEMPDAPAEEKAAALVFRGRAWGESGERRKENEDYTAVIEMAEAPAQERAEVLFNRGFRRGQSGETVRAIEDYTAVIEMAEAPAKRRAQALFNRGVRWGQSGETEKAIGDYTAVIEMAEAPVEQKARAFVARGWRSYTDSNDVSALIHDSREALVLAADNPDARMNLALGLLLTDETAKGREEYETLIAETRDPSRLKAAIDDLDAALEKRPEIAEGTAILELLRIALASLESDPPAPS